MKSVSLLILIFSLLALSACSSHLDSDFACPYRSGTQCQSLTQVNQAVDQGKMDVSEPVTPSHPTPIPTPVPTGDASANAQPESLPPLRQLEKIQRIWIAAYQDKNGNYHEPSTVYTVIQPSGWHAAQPLAADESSGWDDTQSSSKP